MSFPYLIHLFYQTHIFQVLFLDFDHFRHKRHTAVYWCFLLFCKLAFHDVTFPNLRCVILLMFHICLYPSVFSVFFNIFVTVTKYKVLSVFSVFLNIFVTVTKYKVFSQCFFNKSNQNLFCSFYTFFKLLTFRLTALIQWPEYFLLRGIVIPHLSIKGET